MSRPSISVSNVMDQIIHASAGSVEVKGEKITSQVEAADDYSSNKRFKAADPTRKFNAQQLLERAEEGLASSSYRPKVLNIVDTPLSSGTVNNVVSVVKAATLSLEKAITKNQLLRAQHADNPALFMESELSLHEEITALQALAALEEESSGETSLIALCYNALIDIGTLSSLVSLIQSHENVDIGMAVVQLMGELLDPSLLQQSDPGESKQTFVETQSALGRLAHSFIHEGGLDGAISNLLRLVSNDGQINKDVDEENEIQNGVEHVLSLIENLLDLDQMGVLLLSDETNKNELFQSVAQLIFEKSLGFVSFLLTILSEEPTSSLTTPSFPSTLRLHASEILATLLQHDDFRNVLDLSRLPSLSSPTHKRNELKSKPSVLDGMDSLLLIISKFRKSDPEYEEECECLENTFDALASTLLYPKNIQLFLERQGIELMLRCIREKVHSGSGAMKILDFCLSGTYRDPEAIVTTRRSCHICVDAGGFKVLFPILMGKWGSIPKPARCTDAGNTDIYQKYLSGTQSVQRRRVKLAIREKREWLTRIETHSINILYSLVLNLDDQSPHDAKNRLLSKFIECDFEKCDCLVELCLKYDGKMEKAEFDFYKSDEAEELEGLGRQDELELLALRSKLLGGGEVFYKLSVVVAYVASCSKRCHEHILHQLKTLNYGIGAIKAGLTEYLGILDPEQSKRISDLKILDKI